MIETSYTWRPLGDLLVETGWLTPTELEGGARRATPDRPPRRRDPCRVRLHLGVHPWTSPGESARRRLATRRLRRARRSDETRSLLPNTGPTPWRPLGKLLIEKEFLTRAQLEHALDEQRASGGLRLLGEILVGSGVLSGVSLARALAEQQGLELESGEIDVTTVLNTSAPGQDLYQVREVVYEPRYQAQQVIYKSVSFLEAADFAAEFVEDLEPEGVEIERTDGTASETVWTYSKERAVATANARTPLAETFGFDPTLWDGANPHGPVGAARWPAR